MTLKKVSKPLTLHLLKNKTCKTTDFFVILKEDNKKKKVGLFMNLKKLATSGAALVALTAPAFLASQAHADTNSALNSPE